MRLTLFGANGPTGRLLTAYALAAGHDVVAVTRHPAAFPVADARLTVVTGDAYDPSSVLDAVRGSDAVLSALGTPFTRRAIDLYSRSCAHVLAAMGDAEVKRLVVVSSSGTEPTIHEEAGFVLNRVVQPLVTATIGRTTYEDMRRMEAMVRGSDLAWTIVRPSGLFDSPRPTAYRIEPDRSAGAFTARADLAAAMLAQVDDDRFVGRVAAVTTTEGVPSIWQLLRKEAFKQS